MPRYCFQNANISIRDEIWSQTCNKNTEMESNWYKHTNKQSKSSFGIALLIRVETKSINVFADQMWEKDNLKKE